MRALKLLGWALWVLVTGFSSTIFAWSAANIPAPETNANFPFPGSVWTYLMAIVATIMLIVCIYGLFRMLDETLPEGDPCRILS